MTSLGDKRHCMVMVFGFVLAVFFVVELFHSEAVSEGSIKRLVFSKENSTASARNLLQSDVQNCRDYAPNWIEAGMYCIACIDNPRWFLSNLPIQPGPEFNLKAFYVGEGSTNRLTITLKGKKKCQAFNDGDGNRIGTECSKDDIVIYQGSTAPLPNGIPAYTVQILNVCASGCSISDIHVSCGWFSSARLVNPRVFRRLDYDDCLVNDGEALGPGETLSFQYANSFRYPLSVVSVACC